MTLERPNQLERCPGFSSIDIDPNRNIIIVPKRNREYLTDKQLIDYYEFRKPFLTYLLRIGKQPDKATGYSPYTVCNTARRTANFDHWAWKHTDGYQMPPTEADAKAYMDDVAFRDIANSTKGKVMEALLRYSAWLSRRFDADEWEFSWTFQSGGNNTAPKDFLSKSERRLIREAALEKDGTPSYGIEPEELGDSEEGSWKFTSLVWTSLDAGLRPVEVGGARTSWVDTANQVLRIPREDSAKNDGNWTVSLTNRTAISLERWLEQRDKHPDYDGMETLWLTRRGNPYGSNELRRLLHDLCDRAGIDYENRSMSWYTIRHSVGTLMTDERDLAATKAQLRHKNPKTTMKYDAVPPEARREALDKMG